MYFLFSETITSELLWFKIILILIAIFLKINHNYIVFSQTITFELLWWEIILIIIYIYIYIYIYKYCIKYLYNEIKYRTILYLLKILNKNLLKLSV